MAVDAEEAGMDAFMDKPFKLEELTAVYVKLLEGENRHQRDRATLPPTRTQSIDIDTPPLGTVAGPRLIRNVTPNAKIFVDASESDDMMIISHVGSDISSPTVAVAVSESELKGKVEASPVQPPTGSSSGNGMTSGNKHNGAKVYATSD